MEKDDLSEKQFRVMILKMNKEVRRKLDAQSEKSEVFNKENI